MTKQTTTRRKEEDAFKQTIPYLKFKTPTQIRQSQAIIIKENQLLGSFSLESFSSKTSSQLFA